MYSKAASEGLWIRCCAVIAYSIRHLDGSKPSTAFLSYVIKCQTKIQTMDMAQKQMLLRVGVRKSFDHHPADVHLFQMNWSLSLKNASKVDSGLCPNSILSQVISRTIAQ